MNDRAREAAARRAKAAPPPGPSLFDRVRSVFGLGAPSIRDDIADALEDAGADTVFSTQERAMMRNVLGLHELRVEDIMVPRADVIAVSGSPLEDVTRLERIDFVMHRGVVAKPLSQ